ncbi:MAG: hypothetical protein LW878_01780 [Proteobacteria bacterium]|jgi:hypothetical protein|nr:hypothetical protein [Pseudomonadota bacterium]
MINEIKDLEEKIRQAQLTNDTSILNQIISDDLQFELKKIEGSSQVVNMRVRA